MYANNVQQLVTHQTGHQAYKPEVVLFNGWSCCRQLSIEAVWVWLGVLYRSILHYEGQQYLQKIVKLSPLPVIVHRLGYSEENKVKPEVVINHNP